MTEIRLGERYVGAAHRPFIIAEMSCNHNQSLDRALAIVEAAAEAGAHALKLQTAKPEHLTIDARGPGFVIDDPDSLWFGRSLFELYGEAQTPWEWHGPIFERCRELGLVCFSSPFHAEAVDFLETLDVPAYKIASFENTDLPLLRKAASTGKPLLISTGMATLAELDEAVRTVREAGCRDLILLKCTSTYPAAPDNTNLMTIPRMRELFGCEVGLSDHTLGIGAGVASVALGATVIEKHFTLSRAEGGLDAAFSMEPAELESLVDETGRAWQALGTASFGPTEKERESLTYRRSLYVTQDLCAGEVLGPENLRVIRPGLGLAPRYYETMLGKRVNRDVKRGTPLSWDLVG